MARFCPLFSSSSGNSIYIGSSSGGILLDVGANAKQTVLALQRLDIEPESIGAVFITHEHSDHIKGLKCFAGKFNIPVYTSCGTLQALDEMQILSNKFLADVIPADGIDISDMHISSFRTSHDSRESVGYKVEMADGRKVAVATDLGVMTNDVMNALCGSDLVMLESNHDIGMLQNGRYPYYLKRRILSDTGHLSNVKCAETLEYLLSTGTSRFVLGHLSKENNIPELAYQTSFSALTQAGAVDGRDYLLSVAAPSHPEKMFVF